MKIFWSRLNFIAAIGLQLTFLVWFGKGLFGKYWYIFWLWLISAIIMYWAYHDPDIRFNNNWPQKSNKTGAEIWLENSNNY